MGKKIGELNIPLPKMPREKDMINYGKSIKNQKFIPREIPKGMKSWKMPDIEKYVKKEWERRFNGEWWLIKGEPHFFPGPCLPFFDYWKNTEMKLNSFRMEALDFFQIWYLVVEPNPNIMGIFDLKCRRLGDTEKALYIMWESATRFANKKVGLQSYTDTEGFLNFSRLSRGNKYMPFWFKPKHAGSDAKKLDFSKPVEVQTVKGLKKQELIIVEDDTEFLGSYIDYESTADLKYDGQRLFRYHLDEAWKIKPHMMNVSEQWNNIKKCITLNNEQLIVGKAIISSTVEEMNKNSDGNTHSSTVEVAEYFWENSDPSNLNRNGRTSTGLLRVFRGYQYAADIDEWGYHKVEESTLFRNNEIASYRNNGELDKILDIYRKSPASPEEALMTPNENCVLHPDLCNERLRQIRNGLNRWGEEIKNYAPRVIEGNLEWENGVFGNRVIFVPQSKGKWHISQQPVNPNNISVIKGHKVPANMSYYRMGCDPYDARQISGKGSDGAFTVKRLFDPLSESDLMFDESGKIINVEDMVTDTTVCDYKYRHKSPYKFYEDVLKTCFYFGVMVFPETNKPGIISWFYDRGFGTFLQFEPNSIKPMVKRPSRQGVAAGPQIISRYVEKLSQHIYDRIWNNHHPRVIKQWSRYEDKKRTILDLAVASGFTELASGDNRYKKEEKKKGWTHSAYNYRT